MKITVEGLWHLGCVTSACCARVFDVTGLDEDRVTVEHLNAGKAPLFEPGLDDLISQGISAGRLRFTTDPVEACASADVLWVTYDTPVDDNDEADVEFVLERVRRCVAHLPVGAVVLISSQLPVGTCRKLENEFNGVVFAYSPENLQLGKAIAAFESAERTVLGTRNKSKHPVLASLLSPFCKRILWMRTESAEMVKHGLNAFLALSITFINELAALCEQTGADAKEVSDGLKSDIRIGSRAYLSAGGPFAGGTLARDVVSLIHAAREKNVRLDVISAIKHSNDWHRHWALRRLAEHLGDLNGRRVALLGLTYKAGTDTLRRSLALELAYSLAQCGVSVRAFDPAVRSVPEDFVEMTTGAAAAAEDSDALVVCTEWPVFREVDWRHVISLMRRRLVLDANRFLEKEMAGLGVEHLSVGRA
jgi:UDPglucose 6-dehydrogenase